MAYVSTFYFSRIIGKRVYSLADIYIGKIKDLIVDLEFPKPRVIAAVLKTQKGTITVDFSTFIIKKDKGQYCFDAEKLNKVNLEEKKTLYLAKSILDRQIIDMDGKKLERVNDIRLAIIAEETFLIAVDVGFEGFLRRLGVAKPLQRLINPFGLTMPSHLILWDDVETVEYGNVGIRLSKGNASLERLHPSDLADIIEEMDKNTRIALLTTIDEEKAADILEELEPDIQRSVFENLPLDKAADLLEKMPADEAADILDELRDDKVEELLKEMEDESSEEIRELMDYPDNSVGSIMTTDYISFNQEKTVEETLNELRTLKPESDIIYYIYIIDDSDKLIATVSLRDLIVSEPSTKLCDIMNTRVIYMNEDDKIELLNEIITKYSLLAIPVVDEENHMSGVVIINDVMHNLLKNKLKRN